MQVSLLLLVSALFFNFSSQKQVAHPKQSKAPVEVWCGGDDQLTRGVCYAAEDAFESTSDFELSSEQKANTLVVTIPTNVAWKKTGKRIRVVYTVEFTAVDESKLRTASGSCWNDQFVNCATQIVKHARIAVRKIHHKN